MAMDEASAPTEAPRRSYQWLKISGLLLVVAFSLGLAATLTLVGLMFLYARSRFRRRQQSSRWVQLLPVASAATITVIGVVLCVGAAQTLSVLR